MVENQQRFDLTRDNHDVDVANVIKSNESFGDFLLLL